MVKNIEILLVSNFVCRRKSNCWTKIECFGKQLKLWPDICEKFKLRSKIEILVKNQNFGQQSKLWSKIEILVKNGNVG